MSLISGATEAAICPLTIAGFCQARALNITDNDNPSKASRPFDKTRAGFVIGEGAAIFVLEKLASAPAKFYCKLTGFGASADAHHITSSRPDGLGAILAMKSAMKNIDGCVDYINAHATSTPVGDEAEAMAIKGYSKITLPCVSSSKGHLGHLLGAAGAVEAAICALALKYQTIPPTANLVNPICDDIDFVALKPRQTNNQKCALQFFWVWRNQCIPTFINLTSEQDLKSSIFVVTFICCLLLLHLLLYYYH